MKVSALSASALVAVTTHCVVGAQDVTLPPLNTRGISFPSARFRPWSQLSASDQELAGNLGYGESNWNKIGSNPTELIAYSALNNGKTTVDKLGIAEAQWDCYMNHYTFFEWDELDADVISYLVALGWTEATWQRENPIAYQQSWAELSDFQQSAATELCFFQATWDGESMTDAGADFAAALGAPSAASTIATAGMVLSGLLVAALMN